MEKVCYLCGNEEFSEVMIFESVKVKELELNVEHRYFECLDCKERYANFENPNENLVRDYNAYRNLKKWHSPEEVKAIRKRYRLSQKEYAALLGISYSTLSAIENGSLQSKAHESQFVLSKSALGMKYLIINNKTLFSPEKFSELLRVTDDLAILDNDELRNKFFVIEDKMNQLTIKTNVLEYDIKEIIKKDKTTQPKLLKNLKEKTNGIQSLFIY